MPSLQTLIVNGDRTATLDGDAVELDDYSTHRKRRDVVNVDGIPYTVHEADDQVALEDPDGRPRVWQRLGVVAPG